MKIARWVVHLLAIAMLPVMLWLLHFLDHYTLQKEYTHYFEYNQFTDEEQAKICDLLELELAQDETLSMYCLMWPPDQIDRFYIYVYGDALEKNASFHFDTRTSELADAILTSVDIVIPEEFMLSSKDKFIYQHVNELFTAVYLGGFTLELIFIVALIVMFRKSTKENPHAR